MASWITISIGIVIVIIGSIVIIPNYLDERIRPPTQTGVSLAHSNAINFTRLEINFVTTVEPHYIHINYNLAYPLNRTSFVALVIPYIGMLEENTHTWNSKEFPSLRSVIIYKHFEKNSTAIFEYDQNNMFFELNDKLDSKQLASHSVVLPFSKNPLPPKLGEFIHTLSEWLDWDYGWDQVQSPPEVRFSLSTKATALNSIPQAELEPFFHMRENVTNYVFTWNVTRNYQLFYVDYEIPEERQDFNSRLFWSGILFGVGISAVIGGIAFPHQSNAQRHVHHTNTGELALWKTIILSQFQPLRIFLYVFLPGLFYEPLRVDLSFVSTMFQGPIVWLLIIGTIVYTAVIYHFFRYRPLFFPNHGNRIVIAGLEIALLSIAVIGVETLG
ncbi:MAG: hypothetical protein ACRD38_11085, partial [Nitrososphaerales archaeon]